MRHAHTIISIDLSRILLLARECRSNVLLMLVVKIGILYISGAQLERLQVVYLPHLLLVGSVGALSLAVVFV